MMHEGAQWLSCLDFFVGVKLQDVLEEVKRLVLF